MAQIITGNSDLIKQVNRSLVLDLIRQRGPISKADVKQITGLNFTTVTNAVKDLISQGLVQEIGYGTSSGGRRPMLLTLNPEARYVIGCHLQSTELIVGLYDLVGRLLYSESHSKLPADTPEMVVDRIRTGMYNLLAKAEVDIKKVEGMGVAAPGPLDAENGVLYTPPNMLGWHNVPLKQMLEQATGVPVFVDKDGNAAAVGEVWFGKGKGVRNLIFIIVDDGIGAGIVVHGQLYRGSNTGAGEIGHITIDLDGPRCSCGNYGCLEAIASGFALVRKAGEAIRRGATSQLTPHLNNITLSQLLTAADAGDKLACDLLEECGRLLGIAIANVVNMYNPELIVLGGKLIQHSPLVFHRAQELAHNRAFSVLAEKVRIIPATLGDKYLLAGAAALVFTHLFRGPMNDLPA
ncbi:MAG TPA: ROK family protein [Firmicutes bacterium]|nr:ROK family protein [Bacillota bacterium]